MRSSLSPHTHRLAPARRKLWHSNLSSLGPPSEFKNALPGVHSGTAYLFILQHYFQHKQASRHAGPRFTPLTPREGGAERGLCGRRGSACGTGDRGCNGTSRNRRAGWALLACADPFQTPLRDPTPAAAATKGFQRCRSERATRRRLPDVWERRVRDVWLIPDYW